LALVSTELVLCSEVSSYYYRSFYNKSADVFRSDLGVTLFAETYLTWTKTDLKST